MKSKRYMYFFTLLCLLYILASFQLVFSQRLCNRHGFYELDLDILNLNFPEAYHFISIDTAIVFGSNKVFIYHNLRSRKQKSYRKFLSTHPWDDPNSDEFEKWTCTGVSFINSQLGYASAIQYAMLPKPECPNTNRGGVFKTKDGGLNWLKIKGDSSLLNCGILDFKIRNNIWYALTCENFIQSTDEGLTWTKIGSPVSIDGTPYAFTFYFIDDSTIIAGGLKGIGKSIDGGKTWKTTLEINCIIRSIIFLGKQRGFAVGSDKKSCTYQTEDGGETWQSTNFGLPSDQSNNLAYLFKVNDSTAYGTGEYMKYGCFYTEKDKRKRNNGFMARTFDKGKTWKFFYDCTIADWDDTPGLITQSPTFVWASDKPDSSVFILAPGQIFYSGRGGEPNSIEKNEIIPAPNFRFYPNPASNQFTIESSEGIKKVLMYDAMGKRVLFKESSWENAMKIDVKDFTHGIYLLQVETDAGSATQKVVVE